MVVTNSLNPLRYLRLCSSTALTRLGARRRKAIVKIPISGICKTVGTEYIYIYIYITVNISLIALFMPANKILYSSKLF